MNRGSASTGVLGILGTLILSGGFVYWQYTISESARANVAQLEAKALDEDTARVQLREQQEAFEEIQVNLNHLEQGVPQAAYIPTLLTELEALGRAFNIDVKGVKPIPQNRNRQNNRNNDEEGENESRKPYEEITIEVTGSGYYRDTVRLLDALQSFNKILAVKTINLQPETQRAEGQPKLQSTITLSAFVFKEEMPEGTVRMSVQIRPGEEPEIKISGRGDVNIDE